MKIEILGTGCAKCTVMAENAKTAISKNAAKKNIINSLIKLIIQK